MGQDIWGKLMELLPTVHSFLTHESFPMKTLVESLACTKETTLLCDRNTWGAFHQNIAGLLAGHTRCLSCTKTKT